MWVTAVNYLNINIKGVNGLTLVKRTWIQFCDSCENDKRRGMYVFHEMYVLVIREITNGKAKDYNGEVIDRTVTKNKYYSRIHLFLRIT